MEKDKTSWQGVVMSTTPGVLLGGVKVHSSLRFAVKSDAEDWVKTVLMVNGQAFRPCIGHVVEVEAPPHFRHCDRCNTPWYGLHKCEGENIE